MDNPSLSILQNGTTLPGNWDRSFEASVLDQGVAYPADMAALPTSTPNPANLRRKSRRSWFETTPKGLKLEIAVEKPEIQTKPALKSESMEVLTLTHFSGAPRLDFGTIKPGQERMCTLLIRNPHDYEQNVRIEKVPEKKHFSVPCKEFVVGANESYHLEITWSPVESGNFREMFLMQVDSSYRLQAYVLGKVLEPPAKKKRVRKTGLLASKVAAPFSVIHTASLANINHDYSPEKKTRPQTKASRPQGLMKSRKPDIRPGNQRRSSGRVRRSPRLSAGKQLNNKQKENEAVEIITNDENNDPCVDTACEFSAPAPHKEQMPEIPKAVLGEKIQRKKMRRSNTYSNVSGLGLTIPIIHGESVKGHKDTSLLHLEECNVSGIKLLEDSQDIEEEITKSNKVDELPSFMAPSSALQSSTNIVASEPSFLNLEDQIIKKDTKQLGFKCNLPSAGEPSFLAEQNMSYGVGCEPSFLNNSSEGNKASGEKGNLRIALLKAKDDSFQDSLELVGAIKATNLDEPPSFLAEQEENKPNKPGKSTKKKSGQFETDSDIPAERKLLRSLKRRSNRQAVSPDSFLKATQSSARNIKDTSANVHEPLNDSVGQSSILKQLRSIKSFIHDKSFEIDKSVNDSVVSEATCVDTEPELKKIRSSPRLASLNTEVNLRRGTFVTKPENLILLDTQKPSEASPRRTTFTVIRKTETLRRPTRSRSEGSPCMTRSSVQALQYNRVELDTLDEGSSQECFEPEIEQQTCVNASSKAPPSKSDTKSARGYSLDSLENNSAEEAFLSPGKIPEEPTSEAFGRRATLTVTKSRPSDALMEHAQRTGTRALFDASKAAAETENNMMKGIPEVAESRPVEDDNASHRKSAQNSTFEVSKNNTGADSSFPSTPNQLPSSPNPDLSRRSTHVVEIPRVINLGMADRKQLFVPEKPNLVPSYEVESEDPDTSENFDDEDKENVDPEPNNDEIRAKKEASSPGAKKEALVQGEVFAEIEDNIDSPSINTRRRLSARRSVAKSDKSSEEIESEAQTKGQLFFIELDKSAGDEVPMKKTVKKDPQQFLRKRSNLVQQTEDAKAKRVKSDPAVVKEKADMAICKNKPVRRQIQSETINMSRARANPRSARNMGTDSDASMRGGRTVLKPKAAVMKGLAQSKLILVKKSKTALAKHPLPFAAKNMYYDERWMEKQERGFVNWLNFILTPADEYQGNNVKVKVDAGKLVVDVAKGKYKLAPTNEVLSFRAYSAHRKLNRLRKSACRLFQSDSVIKVIQKIEAEVESRRLLVRKDKMLHADIGAKQKILDLLLSYNPLWLRIGLETVYGEVVPLQSNTDVYGLSRFILTRMLYNPDIAQEFSHPTVPHLYRDGYAEATAQHSLKKFLMLVYFLERAKLERLIEHNPCLFCKDSDAKASKDLLLQFSRDYLSGEGDITRHLGYLGYKVTYSQTALDEFDFAVSSLATDLRDGLRLSRVLELLCHTPDLSRGLRCPAISRLQKIHNVESAFKVLTSQGLDTDGVTTRDVVDGHREKTLKLLWTIILQYQVHVLLDEAQLHEEIQVLQRSLTLKSQLHAAQNLHLDTKSRRESCDSDLHTKNERLDLLMKWCRCVCAFYNIKIENFTVSFSDGRALCHILHYYHPGLLPLREIHCDTVMTHMESLEKNARHNLSTSFNDSCNSSAVFGDVEDPELLERLQKNERENFKVLFEKVKELGGVPLMLKWSDMSGTIPDEKVVITYLLYLCARLLDIRHESRAARVIQMAWRKHKLAKVKEEYKVKNAAAAVIQRSVRKFLTCRREKRRLSAAVCIQRVWRGHSGRKEARYRRQEQALLKQQEVIVRLQSHIRGYLERRRFLQKLAIVLRLQQRVRAVLAARRQRQAFLTTRRAACVIQACWRAYRQTRSYQDDRRSVILCQAAVRRFNAVTRYRRLKEAVVTVQRGYRSKCEVQQCRQDFLTARNAVISLQASARGYLFRQRLKHMHSAATLLQSLIRSHQERKRFLQTKIAIVTCQRIYRAKTEMKKCRNKFLAVKKGVVALQSVFRGNRARTELQRRHVAATILQAFVRGYIQQRKYLKLKSAAVVCQRRLRSNALGVQCRQEYLIMKGAAITIQATFRAFKEKRTFRCMRAAAVTVQASVRSYLERKRFQTTRQTVVSCQRMYRRRVETDRCRQQFLILKGAAITLQAAVRGSSVRKDMRKRHSAATVVLAYVRMFQARVRYLRLKQAVVLVQKRFRLKLEGTHCRKQYLAVRSAVVLVQAVVRGHIVRQDMKKKHAAAVVIQALLKGRQQRQQYQHIKSAAILCQRRYRSKVLATECRKHFLINKGAAITLQSAFRSYRVRKAYKHTLKDVTTIQAQIRGYLERKKYHKTRQSAITVQRHFRAKLTGEVVRKQFLIQKGAAITIQSAFRSYRVRKDYKHTLEAITTIQAHIRGYLERNKYHRIRQSAITVQRHFRAKLTGEAVRKQFLIQKGAAITLQSAFRSYRVRKDYKHTLEAITTIQAQIRSYLERNKYHRIKQSAITVQRHFRAKLTGEVVRKQFLIQKGAAITIQSAFRSYRVRKNYKHTLVAVKTIQAQIRGFLVRKKYQELRQSAITVQRHFRAKLTGEIVRKQFLIKKGAAITLQSVFRSYRVRKDYKHTLKAVTTIQAHIRGYLERKKYHKMRRSAITVQRHFRAKLTGVIVRKQFLIQKGAAITIQSVFRSYRVRKDYKCTLKALTTIQAHIRRYLERKKYHRIKQSAITVQRHFRAKLTGDIVRKQFLIQKGAAITIQSAFRSYRVRKEYKHTLKAVTTIQAHIRGYLERKKYQVLRQSAITVQRLFRAKLTGEVVRKQFLIKKGAAITLQATFRCFFVRKDFKLKLKAITALQAQIRGYLQRNRYQKVKRSAIVLQRTFRAKLERDNVRRQFLDQKRAVITLQSAVRGYLARKALKHQHGSATVVQSCVRGFLTRARYLRLRSTAIACQRFYRRKCAARNCRQQFQAYRAATVAIQSAIRGFLVRREILHQNKAATVIQSHARAFIERRQHLRLRNVTIMCQRLVRSNIESRRCRKKFLIAKGAVITIQAAYRSYAVRKDLQQKHQAATVIQAETRRWLARRGYMRTRQAAVSCQRWYRAHTESNKCRQQYQKIKTSVVTLQSAIRGFIVRKELRDKHKAATVIQSSVRRHLVQQTYRRLQHAVQVCQRRYREKEEGRTCRVQFLVKKGAVITMQAAVRGYLARKHFLQRLQGVTRIQALVRGSQQRNRYLNLRQAAVLCQAVYRNRQAGRCVRQQYLETRKAALTLQAAYRGYRVRQQKQRRQRAAILLQSHVRAHITRTWYLRMKQAAVVCQRSYRGKVEVERCRTQFLICKGAAITMQACVRGFLVRQQLKRNTESITKVQALVRAHITRKGYLMLRQAAITCQRRYRAHLEGRECQQRYLDWKNAALVIQAYFRGYLVRRELQHKHSSATTLQAHVRGHLERQKYLKLRSMAVYCQRRVRAKHEGEQCRQEFLKTKAATVRLQAVFRGFQARKTLKLQQSAALVIQTVIRGYMARKHYLSLKWAAMVCQLRVRRQQRLRYLERYARAARAHLAAVAIQRCVRNYRARRLGEERMHSVLVIQRWMRSKLQRLQYVQDRQRVVVVQRQVRVWLRRRHTAARVIQRMVRAWLGNIEQWKDSRAATKIQALWRGHCIRKNSTSKKLTAARHRVKKATASATEDRKLGNRTTSALDFLLRYQQLSQVLDAISALEVATRLSWVCCERLVEANAVTVLYRLMRGCNRSIPNMNIIKVTVSVLLNVAKYERTRPYLYAVEEGVSTLLEIMSIYREKKGPIFTKTCNLLGIMALDDPCKMKILKDRKLLEKLQSLHNLTARKHKVEETQRVTRQKMNATMNRTFLVSSPVKRHSIKPDWSLHRNKMNEIENPLKAINFVFNVLEIQSKGLKF